MAKGELPGSMDLLLDTMCNTFGGVMFIAISMALTVVLCHRDFDDEAYEESVQQQINTYQQQNLRLEQKMKNLELRLGRMKNIPLDRKTEPLPEADDSSLAERLAGLELQKSAQQHRMAQLRDEINKLNEELKAVQAEQQKLEQTIDRQSKNNARLFRDRDAKVAELRSRLMYLRSELEQIPQRSLHFSRQKYTNAKPYVVIVQHDRIYRLGCLENFQYAEEVSCRTEDNVIYLTPRYGVLISETGSMPVAKLLPGFDRSKNFVWVMVAPDSYKSFVPFRRTMRKHNLQVHWYTQRDFQLFLTNHANYTSSN